MAAPTIDMVGGGSSVALMSSAGSEALTVITGIADDIIYLLIGSETATSGHAVKVSSVSSSPALTWAQRSVSPSSGSYNQEAETWWAHAPTAEAYSIAIDFLVNIGGTWTSGTFDDATVIGIPITGADTSAPFDVNVSLPAITTGTGTLTATISTSATDSLVIGFLSSSGGIVVTGGGSPLSVLTSELNGGGSQYEYTYAYSGSYSSPQGGVAVDLEDSGGFGATLTASGTVTSVDSPAGGAFGRAAQLSSGGYLYGPAGAGRQHGAITTIGSGWSAECIYTPSADDISSGTTLSILSRSGLNTEWALDVNASTSVIYAFVNGADAGSFALATPLVAGTPYALQVAVTSDQAYIFCNGVSLIPAGTAVTLATPDGTRALWIGDGVLSGSIDEIRISDIARNTGDYTPATAPFAGDSYSYLLYHLDGVAFGLACPINVEYGNSGNTWIVDALVPPPPPPAYTGPSVDMVGGGASGGSMSTNSSMALTVITGIADDIIYLCIGAETNGGGAIDVTSVVSDPVLTWTQRAVSPSFGGYTQETETWWAHAPTARAYSVLVTFSTGFDDAACVGIPITGANTTAPFDANGSLPAITTGTASIITDTISTTATDSLVIGFLARPTAATISSPVFGTLVLSEHNGGGTKWEWVDAYSESYSAPQSGLACSMGMSSDTSEGVAWIVDALVPPGGSPPPCVGIVNRIGFAAAMY